MLKKYFEHPQTGEYSLQKPTRGCVSFYSFTDSVSVWKLNGNCNLDHFGHKLNWGWWRFHGEQWESRIQTLSPRRAWWVGSWFIQCSKATPGICIKSFHPPQKERNPEQETCTVPCLISISTDWTDSNQSRLWFHQILRLVDHFLSPRPNFWCLTQADPGSTSSTSTTEHPIISRRIKVHLTV